MHYSVGHQWTKGVDRWIFKTCNIVQKNCPDMFHFSVWHSGEPTTHQSYCRWIHRQGCAESPSLNQNSVIKCKTKKLTAILDNHTTAQLWLKLTYLIHKANSHHLGRLSSSFCIQDNWLNPWANSESVQSSSAKILSIAEMRGGSDIVEAPDNLVPLQKDYWNGLSTFSK